MGDLQLGVRRTVGRHASNVQRSTRLRKPTGVAGAQPSMARLKRSRSARWVIHGSNSEFRASRRAGERNDIANIGDAGHEHKHPFEAKTKAGMRHTAITPEIKIPFVVGRVHFVTSHVRFQKLEAFFTLTPSNDLADSRNQ